MKITSRENARWVIHDVMKRNMGMAAVATSLCTKPTASAAMAHELAEMVFSLEDAGLLNLTITGEGWEEFNELRGFARQSWIAHLDPDDQRNLAIGLAGIVERFRDYFEWPEPKPVEREALPVRLVSTPDRVERHEIVRDPKGGIIGSLVQATDATPSL